MTDWAFRDLGYTLMFRHHFLKILEYSDFNRVPFCLLVTYLNGIQMEDLIRRIDLNILNVVNSIVGVYY